MFGSRGSHVIKPSKKMLISISSYGIHASYVFYSLSCSLNKPVKKIAYVFNLGLIFIRRSILTSTNQKKPIKIHFFWPFLKFNGLSRKKIRPKLKMYAHFVLDKSINYNFQNYISSLYIVKVKTISCVIVCVIDFVGTRTWKPLTLSPHSKCTGEKRW
jgi:hypothetical protein